MLASQDVPLAQRRALPAIRHLAFRSAAPTGSRTIRDIARQRDQQLLAGSTRVVRTVATSMPLRPKSIADVGKNAHRPGAAASVRLRPGRLRYFRAVPPSAARR